MPITADAADTTMTAKNEKASAIEPPTNREPFDDFMGLLDTDRDRGEIIAPVGRGTPLHGQLEPGMTIDPFWTGPDFAAGLEDVDRFRDQAAAAHVGRLGLRVPVFDVALLVLELPDLHDQEVAFANPHALLQLPRDATEAALPVLAHHANPRGPEKLVRDPEDLPVFPPGHSDADDLLLFGHSRDQGEGGLKRFRLCSFSKAEAV